MNVNPEISRRHLSGRSQEPWIDYVRVVALCCVILLHTSTPLLEKYRELPAMDWMVANIYQSSVRACVPLFFMISGYLLLPKDEPIETFFKKRVNKVLVPLVAWTFFFMLWRAFFEGSLQLSFRWLLRATISPVYYHLWFMYAIIGLYLCIPILRPAVLSARKNLLNYYIALWLVVSSLLPLVEAISGATSRFELLTISGFSGYLILGLVLGKLAMTRKRALLSVLIFLLCLFITIAGTKIFTARHDGILYQNLYGYLSPNVIGMSAALFLLIKYAVMRVNVLTKDWVLVTIRSISAASLGIYLVHTVFLGLLQSGRFSFGLRSLGLHPLVSIPMISLLTFILSYATTVLLMKIPLLKRIVP